jgi:hypothetical protein
VFISWRKLPHFRERGALWKRFATFPNKPPCPCKAWSFLEKATISSKRLSSLEKSCDLSETAICLCQKPVYLVQSPHLLENVHISSEKLPCRGKRCQIPQKVLTSSGIPVRQSFLLDDIGKFHYSLVSKIIPLVSIELILILHIFPPSLKFHFPSFHTRFYQIKVSNGQCCHN